MIPLLTVLVQNVLHPLWDGEIQRDVVYGIVSQRHSHRVGIVEFEHTARRMGRVTHAVLQEARPKARGSIITTSTSTISTVVVVVIVFVIQKRIFFFHVFFQRTPIDWYAPHQPFHIRFESVILHTADKFVVLCSSKEAVTIHGLWHEMNIPRQGKGRQKGVQSSSFGRETAAVAVTVYRLERADGLTVPFAHFFQTFIDVPTQESFQGVTKERHSRKAVGRLGPARPGPPDLFLLLLLLDQY
jgi:hypothetical protein